MNRLGVSRVLLLTPSLDGADGISEVSRQAVAVFSSEVGAEHVETWALRGGRPDGLSGLRFWSADDSRSRLAAWSLAQAARPSEDLLVLALHVHLAPVAVPLVMRGAHLACFLHGVEAWRPLRPRERASVGSAMLLANSSWTARRFQEANPSFSGTRVAVCHLAVGDRPPATAPSDEGYALIVGRMAADERYKGHDLLIDVWPDVRRAVPGARLLIAGDGDDRPRLERSVAAKGLRDAIVFTGRVSDSEREGLYRNAAFFVMPSSGEGFGIAYLEAMRAGKACIAGRGAAAEIVDDGVEGLVVDPGSRPCVANAIVTLFTDTDVRRRMEIAAVGRVRRQFQYSHFAGRLLGALARAGEQFDRVG